MKTRPKTLSTFPWERLVEGPTGCWLWNGPISTTGYGRVGDYYVHRSTYTILIADIPEGLHLDHLCRNRRCGNPWHLDPVTQRVNNLRGASDPAANAVATRCIRGHEFTPENTYRPPKGGRQCRTCVRLRWNRFAARRRGAA